MIQNKHQITVIAIKNISTKFKKISKTISFLTVFF